MSALDQFRQALPHLQRADDATVIRYLHRNYAPQEDFGEFAQAFGYTPPPPPVEEPGFVRSAADSAIALGQGVVTGVKGLTDLAGADNPVSQALNSANETMGGMLSAFRQNELQQRAQKIKEAEESGSTLNEVGAYLGGFAEAPLDTTLQALGTMVPTIAAMMIPGVRESRIAALAARGTVGAAQGVGFTKGGIYESVKQRAIEEGRSPEEAEALAVEAQRYGGENSGQMALGAGLGAGAALGPVERIASGMARRTATQGMLRAPEKLLPRVALGAGAEAIPEGLQGGQQKLAENLAQDRAGFETDPMRGVLGSAALEAAAAAGLGGAVSLPKPAAEAPKPRKPSLAEGLTKIAEAPTVDDAIKAMGETLDPGAMTAEREAAALAGIERQGAEDAKGLKQFGVGKSPPPAGVRAPGAPGAPGEASATVTDMPFADRVLTLREQLADPAVREAVRKKFGDKGLNEATYYATVADKVGGESLPERTRDNLLSVAERMVSASILTPTGTRPLTDQRPGGMLNLPPPDGGQGGPPRIGLDTAPTGTIRVDAEGNAAPETRADQISARQRQAEAESLGRGTPRGAAPAGQAIRLPGPIPTGEATETELVPTGEAVELEPIPTGEATEAIPTGDATELPKRRIPVGAATEIEPEVVQPTDLTTVDGVPYGSRAGALVRAKREGLTAGNVVEIPGAGWVVRPVIEARPAGTRGTTAADVLPKETPREPVGDMAGTAGEPVSAGAGRAPDAGRGELAVRRVAADAGGGDQGVAGTPVAGGAEAAPAGDGGGADAALSSAAAPRNPLQDARIKAALDKPVRENGEQMTRRQWVERKVSQGLKTRVTQEDRIKPMSRMAYFRADNAEQRAHERRVKEAGKKDVYWIGDYEVTKIEYDYAKRLSEQPATPPPPAERVEQAPAGGRVGPATAQKAIDAFNADDAKTAMDVVARLPLAQLQEVGAAIGFRPQINENAKRYRERLAEVADKLTKTARETMARERKLFDQVSHLASEYDRAKQHMERARANGVTDPESTAFIGFYRPTPNAGTTEMRIPQMLDRLRADLKALESDADFAKVAPMVKEARPAIFEATAPAAEQTAEVATHTDPGEAPEPVTKAVVKESLTVAAENRNRKPSEMRAELLAMVDAKLPDARDEYLPTWKAPTKEQIRTAMVGTGITNEARIVQMLEQQHENRVAEAVNRIGYVTFKVPGDGTFRVLNTKNKLEEFRKRVSSSPGFRGPARMPSPEGSSGGERGYGGNIGAITGMIDEGDPQAAVDYAAARGLDIAEVLKGDKTRLGKIAGLTPTEAEAVGEFEPEEAESAQPTPPSATTDAQRASPSEAEAEGAEAPAELAPMPAVTGIPREAAQNAHRGTSFVPEERAGQEQRSFMAALEDAWSRAARIAGQDEKAVERIREVFTDVAQGYRARYMRTLEARSRVMSSMIAGPARFPVERNRKRMETERKRADEAQQYLDRGIKRLIRAARGPIDNSPESELESIRLRLAEREETQETMKAANAALRKGDDAALEDLGFTAEQIAELKKGDFAGRKGFPDYRLTNNNAEIRRLRSRLEEAEARLAAAQAGPTETERAGVRIVEDAQDDRLRLIFDGKPSDEVREDLKANGFKWSPKNGAWQRALTGSARYAAQRVLDKHFPADGAPMFARKMRPEQRASNFDAWKAGAEVVDRDAAVTRGFKTGESVVVEAYHGTARPDRVGTVFNPKRATSSPMAFFTSDPALASSYAEGKEDTSIGEDYDGDYSQWFKVKTPGQRARDIASSWWYLTPEQREKITDLAPRVVSREDDDGNYIIELAGEGHTNGVGSYEYEYRKSRNPLRALVENWLASGMLFNEERDFLKVLEAAGFPMGQVEFDSPRAKHPFVYKTFIRMGNPLVTSDIPQRTMDALEQAAKRDRSRPQAGGVDSWDKNTRTVREWVAQLQDADRSTYAWTSIPDKVTDVLKAQGYDGIIDWSGKGGGDIVAPVYIPFAPTQIKSATGNRGTFDPTNPDIRFSRSTPAAAQDARRDEWMEREAKARGYKDIDDLLAKNYPLFEKLAKLWRKQNQAESLLSRAIKTVPDTIEVDGVERPTRNSEGRLIHPTEEGIRNFWRWFGSSRVVDDQGRPLVVYHGTFDDFTRFSDRKLGANTDDNASSEAYAQTAKVGFWFNTNPMGKAPGKFGAGYTVDMPVYLSIQNPHREMSLDWLAQGLESTKGRTYRRSLMAEGYDGIVLRDEEFGGESWVAFRPEQIKSAIGNKGTFDADKKDILMRRGPQAEAKLTNVQQAVDTITATWANPPEVRVVWDLQDPAVDEDVRAEDERQRRNGAVGTPKGFFYNGKVYIVASVAGSDMDVARTMFHESLGHAGLRAVFGDKLKPLLSQMVKLYRVAVENKAVEYGFADVDEDGNFVRFKSDAHALRAAEEVLAELAETRPTSTWVKRAIAAIRQWLREKLPGIFGDMELSDADIVAQFIVPARDAIVRGQDAVSIGGGRLRSAGRVVERSDGRSGAGASFGNRDSAGGRDVAPATGRARDGQPAETAGMERAEIRFMRSDDDTGPFYSALTPAMREKAAGGLPLFRRGGADAGKVAAQDLINAKGGIFDFNRLGETKQDKVRTVIDGAREFWLGALTRDQIADVYGDEITPVRDYDNLTRAMENERQKRAQDADKLYTEWSRLDEATNDKLGRIMLDATVYQVHPDEADPPAKADGKARMIHARIRREYEALPQEARDIYGKVKAFHQQTLADLQAAVEARIDRQVENGQAKAAALTNVRKMFDQYLQGGPYFPLSRFGDYLVIGKRESDGEKVVAAYETAGEQQAAARALEADGFTVKTKTAKAYSRQMDGAAGKFIGDVMQAVEKLDMVEATVNGSRSDLKNQLLDDLNQMFIRALPDLSYRKHFLHRKNTPGFSADVMRGFASSAFHAASHIARLNHGDQMTFALSDAYQAVENAPEGDFNKHVQVLNELAKRHDIALNPNTHPIASMLNQVGFVMYLGLSPAAGLVNLLQTPMVTLPHLGARYGFGKATASLGKATKDIMAAPMNKQSGWDATASDKLTADEKKAMAELQDEGIIDLTQAHDLAAASGLDTGNVARSKAAFAMARAMKIVGWTFHVPEVMNRQATALSAYRLEMDASGDVEKAKDAAREAIKRTHFDYSSSNRARYMQGNLARVITQFKAYSQNMTYLLGRAAQQALQGETPEVRSIARRQLVATLGATWAMAGTLGLPALGAVMGAIGSMVDMLDDDDEPWDWKVEFRNLMADTFGKEAGEVIAHGIPRALMPWDISGRVGMGELWWRSNDREGQNPREAFANDIATNVLGPTGGTVLGWYTAADHMARGDYAKATEAIVPKFIRDPLKAYREATDGVTTYTGEPMMETTAAEEIGRLLGFAPASVSEMYSGMGAVMNAKTAIAEKRQTLLSRVVKAKLDGDPDEEREAREEIRAFNKRNPRQAITSETIRRSLRNRRRNRDERDAGILLPESQEYLRERGRFAVTE